MKISDELTATIPEKPLQKAYSTNKYIKICARSVRVKIERGDDVFRKHFPIRNYPSLEIALLAAIEWRDKTHLEAYGLPVMDRVFQIKGRRKNLIALNPQTGEKLPDLSTGLSYGFHRGRLLYIVASHQTDGRPKRKRFSILTHGIDEAIDLASKFRVDQIKKDG